MGSDQRIRVVQSRLLYTTWTGEFQNSNGVYGTFDQGGNVWEWNEAIQYISEPYAFRGLRGGSFANNLLRSNTRYGYDIPPDRKGSTFGFRVCQVVPEPPSIIALLGGLTGLIGLRRRKA